MSESLKPLPASLRNDAAYVSSMRRRSYLCQTAFARDGGGGSDLQPFGNIDIQAIDVPQPIIEQIDCLHRLELVLHSLSTNVSYAPCRELITSIPG